MRYCEVLSNNDWVDKSIDSYVRGFCFRCGRKCYASAIRHEITAGDWKIKINTLTQSCPKCGKVRIHNSTTVENKESSNE